MGSNLIVRLFMADSYFILIGLRNAHLFFPFFPGSDKVLV